jgi:hypothetical protein
MATTTNYGWGTPDDTDLVKDGALAIRDLGQDIDTTTKALNPETTTGDIAYRSATADTNTRLALGTAGQVLTVNSGATAPEWATPATAGGVTLLSTTSLTGATTTISSINQTYKDLIVIISGISGATNGQDLLCAPNGTTTIVHQVSANRFSGTNYPDGESGGYLNFTDGSGHNNSTTVNSWALTISQYAATDKGKPFAFSGYYQSNQSGAPIAQIMAGGGINTNTAISSLVFSMSSGNLSTGTVLVYGVN